MAKYRLESIASLARQMGFTPVEQRQQQVLLAEHLLLEIDPLKAYPLDYIIFRVTGYRPKKDDPELLTGLALQHDLGLLVEEASNSLDLSAEGWPEPVLQIEDLTQRFNVTSKTIQRWRRRGLPARRFIFAGGRRRVGFLLSTVERFLATHEDQVERGANFSQVTEAEYSSILSRARRLAIMCRCCEGEICRRIARKMNRSPLTIKYTIRKHDQDNPDNAIFALAPEGFGDRERVRILNAYRRGLPIDRLARRTCRPRSAVYRLIVEERIARLARRKVRYYDDELYLHADADRYFDQLVSEGELHSAPQGEANRIPRDLPPYLQELYRTELLTPARERALFLKFNYHKFLFVQARRKLEPQFARSRELNILEGHLRRATEVKNQIVRANLRLVVSVARKHLRAGVNLMELISDGNMTLLRAVESFDVHRGFRFSTYATLSLMKGFARSVPLLLNGGARKVQGSSQLALTDLADRRESPLVAMTNSDHVNAMLARLTDEERQVVSAQFGLGEQAVESADQLAGRLGLAPQRVRQIGATALAKLRAFAGALSA